MKRNLRPLAAMLAGLLVLVFCWRIQHAAAGPPSAPSNCIEHTGLVPGEVDLPGDMRCAGLAIAFHTSGAARSPKPIWAGQWLLLDETGTLRTGTCVFNRGIHPTIDRPSIPVSQSLPKDPSGAKSAYLTWRYGATTDGLTAAGLWAVGHFYAQDAAGSNRALDPVSPLVVALTLVGEMSGRQDLEDVALALDEEAARLSMPFVLTVAVDVGGRGVAHVAAGDAGVGGVSVALQVTGAAFDDESTAITLTTDAYGDVRFEIVGSAQQIEVVAEANGPGPAQIYRAAPADPVGHLPQTLLTAGRPTSLRAAAAVTLAGPTTTTTEPPPTTSTEPPPTTTEPATTTTEPATTTTEPPTTTTEPPTTTTEPATTTTEPATTTTSGPSTTTTTTPEPSTTTTAVLPTTTTIEHPPPLPEVPPATLPRTGSSGGGAAYLGTTALVAGIGMLGAIRRRMRPLA